ncbi:serine hydrolase domain-containing protein [Sinosporangium siamense]|uniref:serine hydrolase domain-containing protein n=1 Tax=Sinosporangium siamense TaxID=1367973 RepID=UPI001EF2AEB3|nr:serine hydrolase domain-containing protein [Sinosporangium siamense]
MAAAVLMGGTATPALAQPTPTTLDKSALRQTLKAITDGGIYGVYSHARDGRRQWRGASGVADVSTQRPTRPDMYHRAGSITKTFVATAVLQQVERGTVELDASVERYLPGLLPDSRVTVRMLLNHTSHISDYDHIIFATVDDLEANRHRTFSRRELVEIGLSGGKTGEPGVLPGSYSNTNYAVLGLLLEKVTGMDPERYITRHVIQRAGLSNTFFPRTSQLPRPHSLAYESLGGYYNPPRDFSTYNMSWGDMAGAVVSTMADLNTFYRALFQGRLIGAEQLAEMRTTVPVTSGPGATNSTSYGLGIFSLPTPCGTVWGHDGGVLGMLTLSFSTADGGKQSSIGVNLTNHPGAAAGGSAMGMHLLTAICGPQSTWPSSAQKTAPALPFNSGLPFSSGIRPLASKSG